MSFIPHYIYYIEDVGFGIIASCFLFMFFFWLFYLCKQLIRTCRDYKTCKYSIIDSGVRAKALFNYKTVIYKITLLILILLLECLVHILIGIASVIINVIINKTSLVSPFETCNHLNITVNWIVIFFNKYPVATLGPILVTLVFITFILLFSFLCTYLKRRYNGYSLDNRVVSRYVVWWCIQAVLLFLCATPYTQILLGIIGPILLFINWIILVKESRRLSRAIRSVLYEILHFECDYVRYKAAYASYKTYRVFISIQLFEFMVIIIMFSSMFIHHSIHVLLLVPCYFKDVYDINIDYLSHNVKIEIAIILKLVFVCCTFILEILYAFVLITPSFILVIPWLLHVLDKRFSIKNYPIRFNYTQFQPLLIS